MDKRIILIIAIIYFVSPIDLMPGILIDDFVALGIALAPFFNNKMLTKKKEDYNDSTIDY